MSYLPMLDDDIKTYQHLIAKHFDFEDSYIKYFNGISIAFRNSKSNS